MNEDINEGSEFGAGYAYCLGLFLAHAGRSIPVMDGVNGYAMWFNGAYDHLYEICVDPNILGEDLAKETQDFVDFCHQRRDIWNSDVTQEDVYEAVSWAENLTLDWDNSQGTYYTHCLASLLMRSEAFANKLEFWDILSIMHNLGGKQIDDVVLGKELAQELKDILAFCNTKKENPTEDDYHEVIRWAKTLLYKWDVANKIPAEIAQYD